MRGSVYHWSNCFRDGDVMRMRRCHIIQIAKEQQRIENQKKAKEEKPKKKSILSRLIGLRQ